MISDKFTSLSICDVELNPGKGTERMLMLSNKSGYLFITKGLFVISFTKRPAHMIKKVVYLFKLLF